MINPRFGQINTHHPEKCCVCQVLVLVNGREDTQDQTGQYYEKPAGEKKHSRSTLVLIQVCVK